MFIATNVHLTKEITEYGTFDAKLHATITDVQESGNSMFKRKEQMMRIIDADAYYESLKDTLDVWDGDEAEDVLIRNAHRAWIKKLNNAPTIKTKQIKYFDEDEKVWKTGSVIVDE